MNLKAKICKIIGQAWLVIAFIFILIGVVGVWMNEGFSGVSQLLSPFNILNYVIILATLAPGYGLILLSAKLDN